METRVPLARLAEGTITKVMLGETGDLDRQDFIAWQVTGGQVAAVIACGREKATATLIEHMRGPLTLPAARAVVARA